MHESGETYLETILIMTQRGDMVRSVDLATELGYSKPSVSRALGILKAGGYVSVDGSGHIALTPSGLERAGEIYERHRLIAEFFVRTLGIDRGTAEDDACRIEHVISEDTFSKIKQFVQGENR